MKKIMTTIALLAFSVNIFASTECLGNGTGTKEEILECLRRAEEQKKANKPMNEKILEFIKNIKITF